jgi:hypothetical protein
MHIPTVAKIVQPTSQSNEWRVVAFFTRDARSGLAILIFLGCLQHSDSDTDRHQLAALAAGFLYEQVVDTSRLLTVKLFALLKMKSFEY